MNTLNQDRSQNTDSTSDTFIQALRLILEPGDLHIDNSETMKAQTNSLSLSRAVVGVAYPRTIEQLQAIVRAASKFSVAIYPVSQGKNIGYGEATPTGSNQLVVGLKHLNQIRGFDAINGEVVVEPGVTQRQLADFLKESKAKFWADVTGATPEASLIGNTLEAGFGHTPIGDHRKHVLQMEVILADGSMVTTAEMPSVGPDLAQLFIQSNFAIVTAMKIPLFPIPEETLTFTVSFQSDTDFFSGIAVLTELRRNGTISSLMHTGNSTRALMTASRFPADRDRSEVMTEDICLELLNQQSLMKFGLWSCVGGLYGFRGDVRNKRKRIAKALKGLGKVQFFSDRKIAMLDKIVTSKTFARFASLSLIRTSFKSLHALHGIMRGQPSTLPSDNIFWRTDAPENLGLIWHAPVIPATAEDCAFLLSTARKVYSNYRFEMPVTLTLIDPKHMTAVFNISYDKSDVYETKRAHAAYKALSEATNEWWDPLESTCRHASLSIL